MMSVAPDQRIKAIFFDLDGTLVDSNERHVAAWDEAFRVCGFAVDAAAIRGQIGKGGDLLVPTLLPDLPDDVQQDLSERHGRIFKQTHLNHVRPFDSAPALLEHAHGRGQRVVLASSADAKEVKHYVALLGIGDVVDATTSIDDVSTSKPAGDIFQAALTKVRPLTPGDVLVVGDTPYDIEAAAKCGIGAIAVRSGGFDDGTLIDAGAVAIYDDVAALLAGYEDSPLGA